jgi:CHAD domain/CYTH domain
LKFDVEPTFRLPDIAGLIPRGGRTDTPIERLNSDYYDTTDHALLRARMTLRRRTGTADVGRQLKVPHDRFPEEIRVDAADEGLPDELTRLLLGASQGRPLKPIARLSTERSVTRVLDAEGTTLAEIADDTVHDTASGTDAVISRWRGSRGGVGPRAAPLSAGHRAATSHRRRPAVAEYLQARPRAREPRVPAGAPAPDVRRRHPGLPARTAAGHPGRRSCPAPNSGPNKVNIGGCAGGNRTADVDQLHGARKAAKRARYAAEAAQAVLGSKGASRQAKRYQQMQDLLGEHQDSLVSAEFLRRIRAKVAATPGENGFTFGMLYEQEVQNAITARADARRAARRYT